MKRIGRVATVRRRGGIVVNPFFIYIFFFGGAVAFYHLKWSAMYPTISAELWQFFLISFVVSFILGCMVQSKLKKHIRSHSALPTISSFWHPILIVVYLLEFIYAGGIPLYWIISGREFIYEDFGIPSVHVFTMTFGAFFSLVKYNEFLNTRGTRSLRSFLWAVLPVVFSLSIVSRGFILINLISWGFIYILNRTPSLRRFAYLMASIAVILFAFGFLGDLRTASRNDQELVENVILDIGDATEEFRNSSIPPVTFWPYIYATSPLANLQNTINSAVTRSGPDNTIEFVVSELIPDFISKRVMELLHAERVLPDLVTPALTVSTVYAASYAYLGWGGMSIIFISLMSLLYIYISLLRFNKYLIPSLAMASTFVAFCIFDNMIYFSGISLQLAWPLLLSLRLKSTHSRNRRHVPAITAAA